jgi:hypothetical protein
MYATECAPNFGILCQIDWGEVLDGQTPYQALSFRRKEDKRSSERP